MENPFWILLRLYDLFYETFNSANLDETLDQSQSILHFKSSCFCLSLSFPGKSFSVRSLHTQGEVAIKGSDMYPFNPLFKHNETQA